eukprot:6465820-Amphidinium_carterae.1
MHIDHVDSNGMNLSKTRFACSAFLRGSVDLVGCLIEQKAELQALSRLVVDETNLKIVHHHAILRVRLDRGTSKCLEIHNP